VGVGSAAVTGARGSQGCAAAWSRAAGWLCDLRHIAQPLQASVSSL